MAVNEPDRIRLTGLRFRATHGVHDFERRTPQDFVVDVTCSLVPRQPTDDLATTVDYAVLSELIAADVDAAPVDLIETLAERIAATCLQRPLIESVAVTVHKPEARLPVAVDDVSVTITRRRG